MPVSGIPVTPNVVNGISYNATRRTPQRSQSESALQRLKHHTAERCPDQDHRTIQAALVNDPQHRNTLLSSNRKQTEKPASSVASEENLADSTMSDWSEVPLNSGDDEGPITWEPPYRPHFLTPAHAAEIPPVEQLSDNSLGSSASEDSRHKYRSASMETHSSNASTITTQDSPNLAAIQPEASKSPAAQRRAPEQWYDIPLA